MTEIQTVREELKALRSLPVPIARERLFTLMHDAAEAHARLDKIAEIIAGESLAFGTGAVLRIYELARGLSPETRTAGAVDAGRTP